MGNQQELVIYGGKPSAAGQAGPGSTDSGPQGHTSLLGLITGGHFIFILQIANVVCGEFGA